MARVTTDDVDALRRAIREAGGLVTLADIARVWAVSTQRAHQIAAEPGFPEPIAEIGGRKIWATAQLDGLREPQP
jgi:hypothetical protein